MMPPVVHIPGVDALSAAPERAVLTLLEAAADIAVFALVAAHPELHCHDVDDETAHELYAALAVIDAARELNARLHRYHLALLLLAREQQQPLPF
jgi:hypothetical protein